MKNGPAARWMAEEVRQNYTKSISKHNLMASASVSNQVHFGRVRGGGIL